MRFFRNRVRCLRCGEVIESKHLTDYKTCQCGAVYVGGGIEKVRQGGEWEFFEQLSETEAVPHRNL